MKNLPEQLSEYGASDYYPLHMPGHKRQMIPFEHPYSMDITEINGFDNLFHAEGILMEAQQRAAKLYGAEETFYLINGSSCGILAAVSASVPRNGRILIARNCHKAVYHSLLLNDLHAFYLYPAADELRGMNGSISAEQVKDMLQKEDGISAVLITSPTYDGVVSDIRAIADMVHRSGAILIVDEAHGAHFAMDSYFPESAVACGADLVINSVHKTLPSMTQTALLHVQGERVDRERLKKYLGVYQSSSPSYVLMAGIDACICQMLERRESLYRVFTERLEQLRERLSRLQFLHLVDGQEPGLHAFAFDRSKVIISTENCELTGPDLGQILRKRYHLEPEMEAAEYVTAIMTVADSADGFERLEQALAEIDAGLTGRKRDRKFPGGIQGANRIRNETVLTITEADGRQRKQILLQESVGLVSAEFIYLYPPGIPVLVPGERIPEYLPELLAYDREIGLSVQGLADFDGRYIYVAE